jgi:putative DNA primase/helicase
MAERMGVAILSITHFSKSGVGTAKKAIDSFIGSIGFVAAPRAAFAVVGDPDDKDRRLFLHVKNNLAERPQGLAFRLEPSVVGEGVVTSRVKWEREPVSITADEVLAVDAASKNSALAIEEAKAFLQELLADGSVPSKTVASEAEEAGVSVASLRRAKDKLGIKAYKDGMKGGWFCALPKALNTNEHAHLKDVSAFGSDDHLRAPMPHTALPRDVEMPEDRG